MTRRPYVRRTALVPIVGGLLPTMTRALMRAWAHTPEGYRPHSITLTCRRLPQEKRPAGSLFPHRRRPRTAPEATQ